MTILPNGVAVTGRTHHAEWCANGLVHDEWFASQILRHLSPGQIMIDGGAHIGTLASAALEAGIFVVAYEPNPDAARCLRHNCPRATIIAAGLGEQESEGHLEVHPDNAGMTFISKGSGVKVVAIDQFSVGPVGPALIKLDVEGMECAALRGARATIERFWPVLIVEVNRGALERNSESEDSLLSLIESLGYRWEIIQPQCRRGDEQYDICATPI